MKKILITAGPVYGMLDANKLVSNRIRGIWAVRFASYLVSRHHQVTLLIADTMHYQPSVGIEVIRHKGFHDYMAQCEELAKTHDSAVMAAAVVNWIPKEPYPTKMPTEGYKEGDIIQVPFILAPRVINRMKIANPELTLIGCKMLINATCEELFEAAYHVLLDARCNLVIANDMGRGIRNKYLVHKDRTIVSHQDNWDAFYADILAVIEDEYYRTDLIRDDQVRMQAREQFPDRFELFDSIVDEHRDRFRKPVYGEDRVFGAVAVKIPNFGWLCSPREKGYMFNSKNAVLVKYRTKEACAPHTVYVVGKHKAALNAPILIKTGVYYGAGAVLHLHETISGVPAVPHAPPGTIRDTERELPGPIFNIEGHGFIKCL